MILRSLQDINNEYLDETTPHNHDTQLKPIQPLVIDMPLPKTRKQPTTENHGTSDEKHGDTPETIKKNKKRTVIMTAADILFYMAILVTFFTVLTSGSESGKPKSVFGYTYFTVLSNSMMEEIPKGSFVLVKQTDPRELEAGDNITFLRDRYDTVTHKIIDIYENYDNSGARGFRTKGTHNANPDSDIVYEANVIGKVVLVLPGVGAAVAGLGANLHIVFIMFSLCVVLSFSIRGALRYSKKQRR